ncbi:MAG: hypothetical protein ACI3VJ_06295 [Hominicoprocola sp.]
MLITIRVPDETTEIYYATKNEDGYSETKSVTMGMFIKVECEEEFSRGGK